MAADKGRKLIKGGKKKTSVDYMAELTTFGKKKIASQRNISQLLLLLNVILLQVNGFIVQSIELDQLVEEHLHVHLLQSLHILQIVSVMEMQMNSVCF